MSREPKQRSILESRSGTDQYHLGREEGLDRLYLTFQGGQHHMGRVQAVNEVGWERRSLFQRVHRSRSIGVRDVDSLEGRSDLLSLSLPVWLDDGQSKGGSPDNGSHLFILSPIPRGDLLGDKVPKGRRGKCGRDSSGWDRLGDEPRAEVEPGLDILGPGE
jgi:hypothetical protein